MASLIHQRCFNHALREAAARCPECQRFYCRECITEHEDRVLCAECLKNLARIAPPQRGTFRGIVRGSQLACGILVAWLLFYWLGDLLLSIEPALHEGTVWKEKWFDLYRQ